RQTFAPFGLLFLFNLLFLTLYELSNPLVFEWYVVPLEPSYLFGVLWGGAHVIDRLRSRPALSRALRLASCSALLAIGLLRYQLHPFRMLFLDSAGGHRGWPAIAGERRSFDRWTLPALGPFRREFLYTQAALTFSAELTREKRVLAAEF